ncbi:ABC transporter substrate-binding protein [Geochorda subterranea]|uniref:Sugar ABC transporter substrate-binding protein n=1 Tax=Geochorda subterranea TaxID=3109564 RepID=A0ABZ1BMH4_9FIRM|nr:sugar ABC transporter substrate-binding protein [Limnochorda sp. LNt]WRP13770.1 sugar ABC transporter substrate-binding protein [Limnochorda sp. LNt]
MLLLGMVPASVAAEKVVLEFPSYQATEPGFAEWWKANIEQFEAEHPNVEIKLIPAPYEAHHQTLLTRFAANNPPDIVHLSARYYYRFADMGWLEPLDPYLSGTDIPRAWSPLQSALTWNGKTYALMLLGYAYGLYYNEKMFEEAGIGVPSNLSELVAAAQALTKDTNGDGRTDQFGLEVFTAEHSSAYMFVTWMLIGNGTHWTDANGQLQLTSSPKVQETIDLWRRIVKSGWTPEGLDDVAARKHFMAGNAAMLIDGSWVAAMVKDADPQVRPYVKVARVPFAHVPSGPSNVIAMPASLSPEKKRLVWEFIFQLTRPENQQAYSELTGSPAPRKGAVSEELRRSSLGMQVFAEAVAEAEVSFMPRGYEVEFAQFSDTVVRGLMRLAVTDLPTSTILAEMERELRSIRGR